MLLRPSHPLMVFALVLMLPACGKKLVTTTLTPSRLESRNSTNSQFLACRTDETLDPSVKPTPGQSALFGYWNWELGTGTACRVFVKFDFATLPNKSVVAAKLGWGENTQRAEGTIAANFPPCEKTMFIANEPWTKFAIVGDKVSGGDAQLSGVVRQWVNGQRANYGVFFVGDESKILKKNKDYCFSLMKAFHLDVTSAVP